MSQEDTFNDKLYEALQPAKKVLELAPLNNRLAKKYIAAHPEAKWKALGIEDVNEKKLQSEGGGFDLIVFDGLLERLRYPSRILSALRRHNPHAKLVTCVSNVSHIAVIERLMIGEGLYGDNTVINRRQLQFFSPSSVYKLLLDTGWLPSMAELYSVAARSGEFYDAVAAAIKHLRAPKIAAEKNFLIERLIVSCTQSPVAETKSHAPLPRLSVVVPVNNPLQYELNVLSSPGLQEIGAKIIPVTGARNAGEAFKAGAVMAEDGWILYCHQDVYLPADSGKALLAALCKIPEAEAASFVVGFAGLAVNNAQKPTAISRAGLFVDRLHLSDFSSSAAGVSLDEFAVLLHKNTHLTIDPELGWHVWGSDLCLQSLLRQPEHRFASILNIPIFHNSLSPWTLPEGYHASVAKILDKYPEINGVPTICGVLSREGSPAPEAEVTAALCSAIAARKG